MSVPQLGTVIGGKYRLLRQLGEGGMATVFEVENTLTLKRAAIKWVHSQFSEPELGLARMVHEARASSRINHENVVNVYDVLEEGSSVFLVMELLEGEPLTLLLERALLPLHALIALLLPALRGLAAAHAAGVVHRDVKPDNIFLALAPGYDAPVPKVIDFGISKVFEPEAGHVTRSGITMGTPRYVSYEQLLGARDVDARTDIYAFGVILYEALTGRMPYGVSNTFGEQAIRFVTEVPLDPCALRPEIPRALAAVVSRALARDREDRQTSMDELIRALEPFARASAYPVPLLALSPSHAQDGAHSIDAQASTLAPQRDRMRTPMTPHSAPLETTRPIAPQRHGQTLRLAWTSLALASLVALAFLLRGSEQTVPVRARTRAAVVRAAETPPVAAIESAPANVQSTDTTQADAGMTHSSAPLALPPRPTRPARPARASARAPAVVPPTHPTSTAPAAASEAPEPDSKYRAGPVRRGEF